MAKIYAVVGAPRTGKTTLLTELKKKGYESISECVEEAKIKLSTQKENKMDFDLMVFELRKEQLEKAKLNGGIIFSDRGLGDTIAYLMFNGFFVPNNVLEYAHKKIYEKVFVLEPLGFYEQTSLRQFPKEHQDEMQALIIKVYRDLGYDVVIIPAVSVEERVKLVESLVNE
ncbi:MAG: ATP-binding protein [Nanoarchaeota archaeon]|nr:ATP-binding protein [Nanoarchaeota archaeon]MBU0977765.1 ATP-binding protein [Nanoarchaeota archaeon]